MTETEKPETPHSTEQIADKLYGRGGEVPESYQNALDSVFNAYEFDARSTKDDEGITAFSDARREAEGVLTEFQVGEPVARELITLVNRYVDLEISDSAMNARRELGMNDLREMYGANTEKCVEGARRVVREFAQKIPWLIPILECGGGNDPKVIAHFVTIAKQRGWV